MMQVGFVSFSTRRALEEALAVQPFIVNGHRVQILAVAVLHYHLLVSELAYQTLNSTYLTKAHPFASIVCQGYGKSDG